MAQDLVLVHGGLFNASCWDGVVAALDALDPSPFDRVLRLDIPGNGTKRGRPLADLSRDDIVAELDDEVRRAGLAAPVLVGHSVAGTLLPLLATRRSYAALGFLTTAVLAPGDVAADLFGDGVHGSEPDRVGYPADPTVVTGREMNRLRFCLDMDPVFAEAWLDDCTNDVIPPAIMNTPGGLIHPGSLPPITYIVAARSPVFPVEWQHRFAARLGPDVRLASIDAGHAPFFTHPEALARLLAALYQR